MSELLVNTIKKADGTGSLAIPAESGTVVTTASPSLGRRNLIINGAMQVAQRGTSSTGVTGGGLFTVDRFRWASNGEETVTLSQSIDAPDGFANSFKVEVTTADSTLEVNDRAAVETRLEGQNLQQLKFGSASAESFTISFWVKSSVAADYNLHIASEGFSRDITSAYTINSANTWEYKTITFVGDTATAIANDNTEGLRLEFHIHAGSTYTSTDSTSWGSYADGRRAYGHTASFIGTLNATWQITGVQLEVGSVATPFEHRSYGEELALCQRYFCKVKHDGSYRNNICLICNHNDVTHYGIYHFPVTMRSAPTGTVLTGTYRAYPGGAATNFSESDISVNIFSPESVRVGLASSAGAVGDTSWLECYLSGAGLLFDAEL